MRWLALTLLTLAAAGCREAPTELVVYVQSDVRDLSAIRLVLRHAGEAPFLDRVYPLRGERAFALPGEVTVTASRPDDDRPVLLEVTADSARDALDYTLTMTARFRARRTTWVDVFLPDRCTDPIARVCPLGQVCGLVRCEPAERAPFDAPPPRDAGPDADASDAGPRCPDGAPPAAEVCYNGLDENCDGRADEGCASQSCPADGGVAGCGTLAMPATATPIALGEAGASGAEPVRLVTLRAFHIDRYEVTVERFRRFWSAGHPAPSSGGVVYSPRATVALPGWTTTDPRIAGDPRDGTGFPFCTMYGTVPAGTPVTCVNLATAMAFCVWDGGRLPTEAEWEYAARYHDAPGAPPPGRRYPWGNDPPGCQANHSELSAACADRPMHPWPVGTAQPAAALFDMAGNVSEWTADIAQPYGAAPCWEAEAPRADPVCLAPGSDQRTLRGGSVTSRAVAMRAASRDNSSGAGLAAGRGFRCIHLSP